MAKYEKEIEAISKVGKAFADIGFRISVRIKVGKEKLRISAMPLSYRIHKELHQRITARG